MNFKAILEIEKEADKVARDFYKLAKQLQTSLNQISAASVCCLQTYRDLIEKQCDSVDECVREEEILLLKAKQLSQTMEPIYKMQTKITTIKSAIISLESQI